MHRRVTVNVRSGRWVLATEVAAAACTALCYIGCCLTNFKVLWSCTVAGLGFVAGLFVRDRLAYLGAPEVYNLILGHWEDQ